MDDQQSDATPMSMGPLGWIARAIGHLLGVSTLSLLLALPLVDRATLELYLAALQQPQFSADWSAIGLHFGLAACCWGLLAVGFHHFRSRRADESNKRVVRAARGSVMLETLIVMIPFLLLTSGLAQLSLRNVAGLLCDLALYQGARTAWVWEPESGVTNTRAPDGTPISPTDVQDRARLASAAVLAPTAPSTYRVPDQTPTPALRNLRGVMHATFAGRAGFDAGSDDITEARNTLGSGGAASNERTSLATSFDDNSFPARAARKLTFAYLSLQNYQVVYDTQNGNDVVSVSFDYQFNVVIPFFAYIFGNQQGNQFGQGYLTAAQAPGGREGWYVRIPRPRPSRAQAGRYALDTQQDL
mgnify:CR=1 FL=1